MSDEPKHVVPPADPGFMNIFDWKDEELQKWLELAVKTQDQHVADNNKTKFFEYKQSEFDAIQLRICIILFGIKVGFFLSAV